MSDVKEMAANGDAGKAGNAANAGAGRESAFSSRLLEMISVRLSVELGGTKIRLRDLLALEENSVVELDSELDAPLSIYANGTLLGHGEVVRSGQRFGIRITEISETRERIASVDQI
ncbi:FliM/FliN family flagellar motor switch protein [Pacificimonas sp. ICDLI1SI03]